ncbi:MAG: hypothetical protein J5750_04645 [Clostridiales bacterium]|nr:hypothetical protein [Clostridiales bacterium]
MKWAVFYEKCSDWSDSTVLKNIYSLEDLGKPSEIADACNYIDSKAAVLLLRKAKDAGVVLTPADISDVLSNVEGPIIGELVQLAMKKGHVFHYEEILDLDGMISESLLSQVISDSLDKGVVFTSDQLADLQGEEEPEEEPEEDEDSDDYDYSEDPRKKKAGLLDILGTFTVASYLDKKLFPKKKPDKKGKKGPFDC